ncbi:UNVERIFIED_CONTAM: hypothetical protein FKN15_013862 [Acipenser sinensis]
MHQYHFHEAVQKTCITLADKSEGVESRGQCTTVQEKNVAADFNILVKTLSTILKNQDTIIQAYEQQTVDASRQRF